MSTYSTSDIRAWIRHYHRNGENVAATCREFGISRPTFYRWFNKSDGNPRSRKIRRKRREDAKPKWDPFDLGIVAEINLKHRNYGKRRVHQITSGHGLPYSESTIGRMLKVVREKCPICGESGRHHFMNHVGYLSLLQLQPLKKILKSKEELRGTDTV